MRFGSIARATLVHAALGAASAVFVAISLSWHEPLSSHAWNSIGVVDIAGTQWVAVVSGSAVAEQRYWTRFNFGDGREDIERNSVPINRWGRAFERVASTGTWTDWVAINWTVSTDLARDNLDYVIYS